MDRRKFVGSALASVIAIGTPSLGGAQPSTPMAESLEPRAEGDLFGNAFEFLPKGETDTVEVVAVAVHDYPRDASVIIRNNTNEQVYISSIGGMVRRKSDGAPVTTPMFDTTAPRVIEAGGYALSKLSLNGPIDFPDEVDFKLEVITEPLEHNKMFSNISVTEAAVTGNHIIGQVTNTTGKTPNGSNWGVVAVCFNDDGELEEGAMDFQHASEEFNAGGSQVFTTGRMMNPTQRFLVAGVATIR